VFTDCKIVPLSRELLSVHLEAILTMDAAIIGEAWQREHYLSELPGKWQYSCLALRQTTALGFLVASQKAESLHIHRLAVDNAQQGRGVGRRLLHHLAANAATGSTPTITLKVGVANEKAIEFYRQLGFHQDSESAENLTLSITAQTLRQNTNIEKPINA